jgi:hypothetical protein
MSHSWSDSVQPGILVTSFRSDESRCSHLLCVQAEADTSWAVLSLWDCSRNSFRFETFHHPSGHAIQSSFARDSLIPKSNLILDFVNNPYWAWFTDASEISPHTDHSFSQQMKEWPHLFGSRPSGRYSGTLWGQIAGQAL